MMIEDEFGPQSVADDIRSQTARPMPREISIAALVVVVVVVVALVALVMI